MALMVMDFYPNYLYYVTESSIGFPNVGTVTDLILKFVIANCFWLFMPWVVFLWAGQQLMGWKPVP